MMTPTNLHVVHVLASKKLRNFFNFANKKINHQNDLSPIIAPYPLSGLILAFPQTFLKNLSTAKLPRKSKMIKRTSRLCMLSGKGTRLKVSAISSQMPAARKISGGRGVSSCFLFLESFFLMF